MKTIAAPGWGSAYITAASAPGPSLDPVDWLAVQQTLARYAFALDQHDLTALEGVLTEDATWAFAIAGESGPGPFIGRAAILDLVREAISTQTDQRRHHLTNIVIHGVDAGTAVVDAYLMLTSNAGGGSSIAMTGFYTFMLHRLNDEWRIARLLIGMDNEE